MTTRRNFLSGLAVAGLGGKAIFRENAESCRQGLKDSSKAGLPRIKGRSSPSTEPSASARPSRMKER